MALINDRIRKREKKKELQNKEFYFLQENVTNIYKQQPPFGAKIYF